jgi:hypothetical protein
MGGFLRIITNRKRDVMPVDQAAQMQRSPTERVLIRGAAGERARLRLLSGLIKTSLVTENCCLPIG